MAAATDRHSKSNGQGQGMNWIRPVKRLAIYLRDGMACVYCGSAVEDGVKLTLDHIIPHSHGGSNEATNIVTCCHKCNSSRGNRDYKRFADNVATYLNHGVTGAMIVAYIEERRNTPLSIAEAKALMARRGGFLQSLYKE